jgi:hypothetical protein
LVDPGAITRFRKHLHEAVDEQREEWSASRRLVSSDLIPQTIRRLNVALANSSVDPSVRDSLLEALIPGEQGGVKAVSGETLRRITGLNPTKAIRKLCLLLGLHQEAPATPCRAVAPSQMSQAEVEAAVRATENPFDLLLAADVSSVVDFGAGDLTFEEHLVDAYLRALEASERDLTIHCLDRLDLTAEGSTLVRAGQERLERLRRHLSPRLQFQFFSDQDMFTFHQDDRACSRYTIAVCHSPASPTFAYEPSRLSEGMIERRLRETKGDFRRVDRAGRPVLEVQHRGEWLTFPPWKFEVYGPLALLDLLSRSGKLCVMGAIDQEVFWEILSQLLPEGQARPRDVFYSEENVRKCFGPTYDALVKLAVGERTILEQPRQDIPRVLGQVREGQERYGFRYVEIRRGALFPGVPAGRTAYVFDQMTADAAPWFLTLVPSA